MQVAKRVVIFIPFLLVLVAPCFSQQPTSLLDRRMSLAVSNEKIVNVLTRIGREGKFSFSYNSSIIPSSQLVTLAVREKTVREILDEIFKGNISYKEKGNHIILSRMAAKPVPTAASFVIDGYVEDALTGERISDVSLYDRNLITSTVTDNNGYFSIRLAPNTSLNIRKLDYRDTTINITIQKNLIVRMTRILKDSVLSNSEPDSIETKNNDALSLPYKNEPNILNIRDSLHEEIAISFLPFLGSNGKLSGNIINDYSINIFGGYSLGTRQIELGFFVNMDRGDVSWLQVAGIGNLVGRNVYGLQASGLFNVNGGETVAAQLTGLGNVNFRDFHGVQLAGISNVNLESGSGVCIAGLANVTQGPSEGVQIAGLGNFQTSFYSGSQFAGLTNFASLHISGSQISALFNYGHDVHGTQIGMLNYADTLGGVPVGLISFVNKGYHKIEVAADEVFYTNIAFRTGVQKFYNILLAGIKPVDTSTEPVWTFGYGIGTAPRLGRRIDLNVDLTSQHVDKGGFTSELSLLNKFHLGIDWKVARKLSLYGGITLNGYLTNSTYTDYPVLFTGYQPSIIHNSTFSNGTNLSMWWGAKIGLRIL